jgi:hypothetical protein
VKASHRSKQLNALRVMQSDARKRRAGDDFRKRHVDNALRRALYAALTGLPADAIRAKALKPEAAGMVLRVQLRSNGLVFGALKRLVAQPVVEDY